MTKTSLELKAYAKLNLGLDVKGRRADGYHELETCMQTVSLWDEIKLELTDGPGIFLDCDRADLPRDRGNLAYRAAEQFFLRTGVRAGIRISIRKRIPAAAGLAGGSADAAAVFRGMNALFGGVCGSEELREMGLALGADIPYCIRGGLCLAEGIGERLTGLPELPPCWFAIVKPSFDFSTARIYAALRGEMPGPEGRPDMEEVRRALREGDFPALQGCMRNVLEFPALRERPELERIRSELMDCGAAAASMSGSGSAMFGIFKTREAAERCAARVSGAAERIGETEVFVAAPVPRLA